jgi:adenylosuccinate synthase
MANVIIVGAQWGDEGKGKVVDLYTEFADVVVRYGGGSNAGHTLVVAGQKLVTHLLPSGILHQGVRCVLGDGMVVDPATLVHEIEDVKKRGLLKDDKDLLIGRGAHLVLPHHKALDAAREEAKAPGKAIGTTRRGIGPAYEWKAARRGVRMGDLLKPERLAQGVEDSLADANHELLRLGQHTFTAAAVLEQLATLTKILGPYLGDAGRFLAKEVAHRRNILFEGAQGTLLDLDHGTYPFVTSSSTIAGGACTGCGIGPTCIDSVIGITKAYATRVGAGPFPTELHDNLGALLREKGGEFGATTGRPRRCGWLDVAALRFAARVNGLTGLALTKLDVLTGIHPIKICVGYRLDGRELDEIPLDADDLARAEPIFEEHDGWDEDTSEVREMADLPAGARRYIQRIETLSTVPIYLISVGPNRAETIVLKNPFR